MTSEALKQQKQAWYQRNREKILAHYATKKDERRQRSREWDQNHPGNGNIRKTKFRRTKKGLDYIGHEALVRRFRNHGLTLDQYHAKVESQDFLCAICREEPMTNYGGSHDGFHIDHDHVTSRVRGLLCDTCNVGIGMLKDSSEVCTAAAAYLSRQLQGSLSGYHSTSVSEG